MSGRPVSVRAARPDEYAELGELTVTAYRDGGALADGDTGYVEALRDAAKRAEDTELLVAVDDQTQQILGTVTLCRYGTPWSEIAREGEAELRMLAVHPDAWGQGISDLLVAESTSRLGSEGFRQIVLVVLDGNDAALRLYARLGFRRAPERDWEPVAGLLLLAHERELTASTA
ncbi:MAG: GNAT family N-acetyltransferase [Actinomycetes bacterium]